MLQYFFTASPVAPRVRLTCNDASAAPIIAASIIPFSPAMRRARRGITGPRKSAGISPTDNRNPMPMQRKSVSRGELAQNLSGFCGANAGSATNNSMSSCRSIGPCTCASIWVSSTRPVGKSAGSVLGRTSSWKTSSSLARLSLKARAWVRETAATAEPPFHRPRSPQIAPP